MGAVLARVALVLTGVVSACAPRAPLAPSVMTVSGPIAPELMGTPLPHEHVLVDFAGAEAATPDRYDREEVLATVLPYLERARALGLETSSRPRPRTWGAIRSFSGAWLKRAGCGSS